jgi:two-component sensor histidine kinase
MLSLGLIIFLLYQLRTRSIVKQNKFLEERVTERTEKLNQTISNLNQEVTEREKAELELQHSLKEKEALLNEKVILLKEIHHRVKNNLQVISSLLYLNSKNITNEETLNIIKDSQNRVKSIALIHERLYQSNDLGKINFGEYIKHLANDIFKSYTVDKFLIKLVTRLDDIFISIDLAVPLGLIINELVSNSFKYAFPGNQNENAEVKIECSINEAKEVLLIVSDNGIGLPEDLEIKKKSSLGLQLVETLVSQISGNLSIVSNKGTRFEIRFII